MDDKKINIGNLVRNILGGKLTVLDNAWQIQNSHLFTPVIPTHELLVDCFGFSFEDSPILKSYSIDISKSVGEYKTICLSIEQGNTYVYIRQGNVDGYRHKDDMVTIFNSDFDGRLYIHWIQNLYALLTKKNLVYKPKEN